MHSFLSIKSNFNYFISQPHQPFFLMGIFWAVVNMLIFFLGYKGIISLQYNITSFHVYSIIFIVFSHFFLGFLLTTFPRFCMTQPIPQAVYTKIFILYEVGSLLFVSGSLISLLLTIFGIFIIILGHILSIIKFRNIYLVGNSPDKTDSFWLLVANTAGVISHILFFLGMILYNINSVIQNLTIGIGVYLYLIFLTFVVAQRMIPFFSHVTVNKTKNFILIVFLLLIVKTFTFSFELKLLDIIITLILAIFLTREFLRWKLPIFTSPAILWVLHLGLFWLPAGLFIDAISTLAEFWLETSFMFAGMHLITIGFITTILIGFGTRVTLGHSGQVPHADKISITLFWLTEVVVLVRFFYSLGMGLGLNLFWLFDIAAVLWIILFTSWGIKFGPTLYKGK
ncbi:NnrS family protein [Hydrogenimonas thermophila]|uniref:Uncharacterized protein involved in response to NO n=1 Tax=Hydrogenimonas thermophila TaxID=223786 RepID=A0A1I5QD73_9BACT|nr:NnrS family protein [Hydrogenimonas thermophila]WOE70815.1 NnrS family protein [Hydrogenimonas thermophila]WOE73333.1 NnrS family protein [Hydrogenimonas thermophila]SFP44183.1 uncharacterized protein involved in response to NO [Hydrogenimonas thermophila]